MNIAHTDKAAAKLDENAIRPDAMMAEADRLHAADLARLAAKREAFVSVSCPACDDKESSPRWEKDGFSFVTCGRCETAYVNPRPKPELLDEYYRTADNYVFWSKNIFPASEATRREHIARPRVKRVQEICERRGGARGGTLVEVGAGHGTFCEEARASGYFGRVIAIEPTPSNAQACRVRGLEVIEKPIEQVALGGEVADVVVSFEVIEHLFRPHDFVSACTKSLRPGGLLVLSCPNLKGFEVAALGTASRTVDAEHLNYFHPQSLSLLLERSDLEVLELTTPGKLDADIVRKRALEGFLDLDQQPFLRSVLVEEWERVGESFQQFLADNRLSAHLWAVARKR